MQVSLSLFLSIRLKPLRVCVSVSGFSLEFVHDFTQFFPPYLLLVAGVAADEFRGSTSLLLQSLLSACTRCLDKRKKADSKCKN